MAALHERVLVGMVAVAVLLTAVPCLAALSPQWDPEGMVVSSGTGERTAVSIVPDRTGGTYVVWAERLTNRPWHIHAQHLLADGTPAQNWIPEGLRLSPDRDTVSSPIAIADELGGAWVAWFQNRAGIPSIRLALLKAEGPTLDDYSRTLSRVVMISIAPQRKPLLVSAADGSVYVTWQDNTLAAYPGRVAVNRFLATRLQASGFAPDGNTIIGHNAHGVESWLPKAGIVDAMSNLVMPFTGLNHGFCDNGVCYEGSLFFASATMQPNGVVSADLQGWVGGSLIEAVAVASDRHSTLDLYGAASADSHSVVRLSTGPMVRQWATSLGRMDASAFDHRLVQISDGGVFHTSLRPTPTGVELIGDALRADGTRKPALVPLTLYGSDQTTPLSALVPDRHAGVVFLRTSSGASGLDLWLGEYSGNPGLDEGLSPLAVAAGDQSGGALGNSSDGATYAGWVDSRTGTQTVRLQRLVETLPTAIQQVALRTVASSSGVRVRIECGPVESIRLERARLGGDWALLAQLDSGREGFVEYEDRMAPPVGRLGYRATTASGGTSESWVEWKPASGFGLLEVRASSGEGAFRVSLSIEPGQSADLELFDLLGRRLDRVRISSGMVGPESFELGHRGLRSSILLVRLSQGDRRSTMRAVLAR